MRLDWSWRSPFTSKSTDREEQIRSEMRPARATDKDENQCVQKEKPRDIDAQFFYRAGRRRSLHNGRRCYLQQSEEDCVVPNSTSAPGTGIAEKQIRICGGN